MVVKCLRTHNADSCEYFSVPSQLKHATQLFSGTPCLKGRLMKAQQPKDVTSKVVLTLMARAGLYTAVRASSN